MRTPTLRRVGQVRSAGGLGRTGVAALVFFALSFVLAAPASADTWIVDDDGGPGVDYTVLQDAIAAAASGDLIVVRDGTYASLDVSGNTSLSIVADAGDQPVIDQYALIQYIPSRQAVVLSGFKVRRLHLLGCGGRIVVDGCRFSEGSFFPSHPYNELLIQDCDLVTISRCTSQTSYPATYSVKTVAIASSSVVISECTFVGRDGQDKYDVWGIDGGIAVGLNSQSTVFFQASTAKGGRGGGNWGIEGNGGNGGTGILVASSSTLHLFGLEDDVIEGGEGGYSETGNPGNDHCAVWAMSGNITYSGVTFVSPGGLPDICASQGVVVTEVSPAVPVITLGGSGQLGDYIEPTLSGPPGSPYFLYFSPAASILPLGQKYTYFLLDRHSLFFLTTGTIPSGVPLSFHFPIGVLPQFRGIPVYFQALVRTAVGDYLSTSAGFVLR